MKQNLVLSTMVALSVLLKVGVATAAVPEDCWTTTNSHIAGQFSVDIDTTNITKDQLMQTLAAFSSDLQVGIVSDGMLILPDQNCINFVVQPIGTTTTYLPDGHVQHETQAHIEARVNPEITHLMTLPGVTSIQCFTHMTPNPGVSVSNIKQGN